MAKPKSKKTVSKYKQKLANRVPVRGDTDQDGM